MCGICGIFYLNKKSREYFSDIKPMAEKLSHRGPDNADYYNDEYIALGHRRLSIIDLNTGNQPITNEDGTLWIVFNGEIYNYKLLKVELERRHKFKTQSDTEVILHLYEDLKEKCLDRLRGMFAFAIWDKKNKTLFIARDRLGKKPLYYHVSNDMVLFGSEIKSVISKSGLSDEMDFEALDYFLTYRYIPSPHTIYKNIKALEPGTFIKFDTNGLADKKKYWQINFNEKITGDTEDYKRMIREKLEESVKLRLISDVPLGAFLSGGVDSSVIVGLMSRLESKPVKTFTVIFKDLNFSEQTYAKMIADKYKTDHNEICLEPLNVDLLPSILKYYDQPYADPSALPTYLIAKSTSSHVKVVLTGDGGDENFAGYMRYRGLLYSEIAGKILNKTVSKSAADMLRSLLPNTSGKMDYIIRFMEGLKSEPAYSNFSWHCAFDYDMRSKLYDKSFLEQIKYLDTTDYLISLFNSQNASNTIDRALYADINSYLPEDLLVKTDIACMANSLEARSPLLDHEFVELTSRIPYRFKVNLTDSKIVFKEAFADLIPAPIINRSKKGFGLPLDCWFRNELKNYIRDILLSEKSLNRGYFNKGYLKTMIDEHQYGKTNHGMKLWTLLCLELWHTNRGK